MHRCFTVVVLGTALLTAAACRTREDAALDLGRSAAIAAIAACPPDGAGAEGCRESFCRGRCSGFADSVTLTGSCLDKCTGRGTCDSDRECGGGAICVMIAPRVRRCTVLPDAGY